MKAVAGGLSGIGARMGVVGACCDDAAYVEAELSGEYATAASLPEPAGNDDRVLTNGEWSMSLERKKRECSRGESSLDLAGLSSEAEPADERPMTEPPASGTRRVDRVWDQWLSSMQSDPEAALAAALAYRQQQPSVRDEWLSAVEADINTQDSTRASASVNRLAVLAPLMAVEDEPARIRRMAQHLQSCAHELLSDAPVRFLGSTLDDGSHVAVVVSPLYLDFVQVLAVAYVPGQRFLWVRHDPIACATLAPGPGAFVEGQPLERLPAKAVVDELAHTIVAITRRGESVPEPLRLFSDVFFVSP